MKCIPFHNITEVKAGRRYCMNSEEQLRAIANFVNLGNDCKGVCFVLQKDLKINTYKVTYNRKVGLVIVSNEQDEILFGIGTGIEGTEYNAYPAEPGDIYYGSNLLSANVWDIPRGSYAEGSVTCGNNVYAIQEWEPIGTTEHPFRGTFEGGAHSIEGLMIIGGSKVNYKGLFGVLGEEAKINHLKISNSYVRGNQYVGSIAGYGEECCIYNAINEGTVVANLYTGGLIGCIKNSSIYNGQNGVAGDWSKGTVSGGQYSGGIVGGTINSQIYRSENNGFIKTPSVMEVGGITGYAEIENAIEIKKLYLAMDCHNLGTIICRSRIDVGCTGGIIGTIRNYSVECEGLVANCWNTGDISSTTEGTGGIVGYMEHGTVEHCWNAGNIQGTVGVGGVVGYAYCGSIVRGCYNAPQTTIKSEKYYVGGIVGGAYSQYFEEKTNKRITICDSFNEGTVICYWNDNGLTPPDPETVDTRGGCAGGVIGYACNTIYPDYTSYLTRVRNCGNSGNVKNASSAHTGGVAGYCKDATLENCYNIGIVEGQNDTGGVVGNVTNVDRLDDHIRNCYNAGPVRGNLRVGGVAGSAIGPNSIEDCYELFECVKSGSGGVGGTIFYGTGKFAAREYNLLELLNSWVKRQENTRLYNRWYSKDQYYPLLRQKCLFYQH